MSDRECWNCSPSEFLCRACKGSPDVTLEKANPDSHLRVGLPTPAGKDLRLAPMIDHYLACNDSSSSITMVETTADYSVQGQLTDFCTRANEQLDKGIEMLKDWLEQGTIGPVKYEAMLTILQCIKNELNGVK